MSATNNQLPILPAYTPESHPYWGTARISDSRTDMTLVLKQEEAEPVELKADSLKLAQSSRYFNRMLYGPFSERKPDDGAPWVVSIEVDEIGPARAIINYINTENPVPLTSLGTRQLVEITRSIFYFGCETSVMRMVKEIWTREIMQYILHFCRMEPIMKVMRISEANDLLYISFNLGLDRCALLILQSLQDLLKLATDYPYYAHFGRPKLDTYQTLSEFFTVRGGESTLFLLSFGGFDFLADAKNHVNEVRYDETRLQAQILELFVNAVRFEFPVSRKEEQVLMGRDHNSRCRSSQGYGLAPGICECAGSDEHHPNCHFFMRGRLREHIDKHNLQGPDYFTVTAFQSRTPAACKEMLEGLLCQSPIRCEKCRDLKEQFEEVWSETQKQDSRLTTAQKKFLQQRQECFGLRGSSDNFAVVSDLEEC